MLCGLADSFALVADSAEECPRCRATSWVRQDLCTSCLLQSGLHGDAAEGDSLETLLAEVQLRDTDWQLGNYLILEEIGRGGMGVIYRARQKHSERIVAVKRVLNYHSDSEETLARFRREAEAAASLDHPNILPIYEVGVHDGLPFFSMKFAPGGTLSQFARAIRNEPRKCVALMAKVTRAVAYAHAQGILHRDLKPGNILLDGRGEPLVSDFGLAKWLDTTSDLTRTLTIFGTPGYIAPEQAMGHKQNLNPTADVYSLGAVLFDLLAGRPPFLGEHALAVIKQAEEQSAPKLRSIVPGLDRDLETICARCLERESKARYQSAQELAVDLDRWLERRPILARRISIPGKAWRWSRKKSRSGKRRCACVLPAGAIASVGRIERRQLARTLRSKTWPSVPLRFCGCRIWRLLRQTADLAKSIAESLTQSVNSVKPARVRRIITTTGPEWQVLERRMNCGEICRNTGTRTVLIEDITGARRKASCFAAVDR